MSVLCDGLPAPGGLLRVLFLGDVVGEPGRKAVGRLLPRFKDRLEVDFAIVNGENSAAGRGITPKIAIGFLRMGAAVITTGDHIWDRREIVDYIATEPRLLRPLNYPKACPGGGSVELETAKGPVAVMQAMGRTFMNPPLDNPFTLAEAEADRLRARTPLIVMDFHAEATSEKVAMGRFLEGRVSAVFGTHTHVQTADEEILPGGTAVLSDAGMCGPCDSVIGSQVDPVLQRFRSGMPSRFGVGRGDVLVCGAIVDIDPADGRAAGLWRVRERVAESDL